MHLQIKIYYFLFTIICLIFHNTVSILFTLSSAPIINLLSAEGGRSHTHTHTHTHLQAYICTKTPFTLHTNDVAMETRPGFAFRPAGCYLATGQRPYSHSFLTSPRTLPNPFRIKALPHKGSLMYTGQVLTFLHTRKKEPP